MISLLCVTELWQKSSEGIVKMLSWLLLTQVKLTVSSNKLLYTSERLWPHEKKMSHKRSKIYKSLLPDHGRKLLLCEDEDESEFVYRRIDVKKGSKSKPKTLSMSDSAIRKRKSRQKKIIKDGKEVTNRDVERIRDREAKKYKKLVNGRTQSKEMKEPEPEAPVLLPHVNALTEYNRNRECDGGYRIRLKRRFVVEDEYVHERMRKEDVIERKSKDDGRQESYVHLGKNNEVKRTTT